MNDARNGIVEHPTTPNHKTLVQTWRMAVKETFGFARSFATQHPDPLGNIEEGLKRLPAGSTKESLLVLVDKTRRDVAAVEHQTEGFRRNLEGWFNNAMEIVDHQYKRWTQKILFYVALFVVVVSNADAITLIHWLSEDKMLRESLTTAAADLVKTQANQFSHDQVSEVGNARLPTILANVDRVQLPVGWSLDRTNPGYFKFIEFKYSPEYIDWVFYKVFGLLISVATIWVALVWLDNKMFIATHTPGTPSAKTYK